MIDSDAASENLERVRRALRESQRRLASEVAGVRALQSISTRLISEPTQESLFSQILDGAMELMASDAASVQMLAADGESLIVVASKNFHPDSLAFWGRVTVATASTCAAAFRENDRVVVTDVESCASMSGTADLAEYRRSSIRAVQSTPLRSRAGRPIGMLSTHWRTPHTPTDDDLTLFDVLARQAADLIERARAESALRESEERFRLLADTTPVMIWLTSLNEVTYVNRALSEFTGQALDKQLGSGWMDNVHPDDVARCRDVYWKAFESRQPYKLEHRIRRHDGEYRWIAVSGVPRFDDAGFLAGYIGSAVDITEHRLAVKTLSNHSGMLMQAQERERATIARELHDGVGQRVAMLSVALAEIETLVPPASSVREKVQAGRRDVELLAADIRNLSHNLHPSMIVHLGLAGALRQFCREFSEQMRIPVEFSGGTLSHSMSEDVAVALFRVGQECLANVAKHSKSRNARVSLSEEAGELRLTISDKGVGFDVSTLQSNPGLGLTSIQERAWTIGAALDIRSTPSGGTTVELRVPVPGGQTLRADA